MTKVSKSKPANRKKTGKRTYTVPRNPDGTFVKGHSGNPDGRPKNSPLKEFSMQEFTSWTDEEKRSFLEKVSPIDRWKMTEGNPTSDVDVGATDDLKEFLKRVNKILDR